MFNTDVHALLDVAVAHNFVDDNSHSVWCHIVHHTSPSEDRRLKMAGFVDEGR